MQHYTYINYNEKRRVVFECDAERIQDADNLLLAATGIEAVKATNIGCIIEDCPPHA